jgi:hypothetical protein
MRCDEAPLARAPLEVELVDAHLIAVTRDGFPSAKPAKNWLQPLQS